MHFVIGSFGEFSQICLALFHENGMRKFSLFSGDLCLKGEFKEWAVPLHIYAIALALQLIRTARSSENMWMIVEISSKHYVKKVLVKVGGFLILGFIHFFSNLSFARKA
jgi:hypothetical protein